MNLVFNEEEEIIENKSENHLNLIQINRSSNRHPSVKHLIDEKGNPMKPIENLSFIQTQNLLVNSFLKEEKTYKINIPNKAEGLQLCITPSINNVEEKNEIFNINYNFINNTNNKEVKKNNFHNTNLMNNFTKEQQILDYEITENIRNGKDYSFIEKKFNPYLKIKNY